MTGQRVILIDVPRGTFAGLAQELERLGLKAERRAGTVQVRSILPEGLLGVVVHHRRIQIVGRLVAKPDLFQTPVIVWYPEKTAEKELAGWATSGAADFIVGPIHPARLVLRFKGLARAQRPQVHRINEAIQAFSRLSQAVGADDDDFILLSAIAREIERSFAGLDCSIMTLSAGGEAGMVITQGQMNEPLDIPLEVAKYPEIRKMLATRKPVAIPDVKKHPLMKEVRELIRSKDLTSILAVPIFFREEVIGLIMLRSVGHVHAFGKTEIAFLEMIAQNAAAALANVRLGREVRLEAKRSRQARRLAKQKTHDLARLEAIIERAADGLVVADLSGAIRGINVNLTNLAGYDLADLEGKRLDEILSPATPDDPMMIAAITSGQRGPIRTMQTLSLKDGRFREMAVRAESIPRRSEWLISMHDVTEEKQFEETLRRTKDFLQNVIESSMDAIISADTKGTIILFNKAAEAISGYRADDVIGKMNIVDLYSSGVARDIMRKLRSEEYGGIGKLETCYNTMIGKNDEEIPINMSAAIIYEGEREAASVGVFQDLRERHRIEKELRQVQEQLTVSQRKETLVALAGAAAHELNQPLTSILGYSQLLKRVKNTLAADYPSHPAVASLKNAVDIIGQESERMAEVVRKIGEVSEFKTRDYVGGAKIMDLDQARGEQPPPEAAILTAILQNMSEGVILYGDDTVIRSANPASVAILRGNPVGKSFSRFLAESDYQRGMEAFERLKKDKTVEVELEAVRDDGSPARLHVKGAHFPELKQSINVFTDVTERRLEEESLRQLLAFREQIMKSSSVAMIALDVDGKISFWNQAAEKLFGYKAGEAIGKPPDFLIHHFDPDEFQENLRMVRKTSDFSHNIRLVKSSGQIFDAYHVDTTMRDEKGEMVGFLIMVFDLSRERALERELKDKTGQIALITEIVEAIRTKVGLEAVLGAILKQFARSFAFEIAAVSLNDQEENELLAISYNRKREEVSKSSVRLYEDAKSILKVIFKNQPAVYHDIGGVKEKFISGDVARQVEKLKGKGLNRAINFPLIYQGEVLGALTFISPDDGTDADAVIVKLGQVTGPLIMALANARLFNQIERKNLELARRSAWMEKLIRATQEISLEMRPQESLERLVGPYLQSHSQQHFSVWLTRQEDDLLAPAVTHRYPPEIMSQTLALPEDLRQRLREKGETLELDLTAPDRLYPPQLADAKSALIVPLLALDEFLGVIILESHHLALYLEADKMDLQVLAAQIAGALGNLLACYDLDISLRFRQGLFEDANALIIVLDRAGRIELINRAFQELLGEPEAKFLTMHFRQFFKKRLRVYALGQELDFMRSEQFRGLVRDIEQGKKIENLKVSIIGVTGKEHDAIFNTSSILDRDGRFQGFIAIGQNVTRFRELEAHLLQAEKLATIGQMAAGIAHELRNPLTGIISVADLLGRSLSGDARAKGWIDQLTEEARRIEALVNNLMGYARPSSEEMFPLDLRKLVADALSFSHYEIGRNKVSVKFRFSDNLPRVKGIKDQLQQVLINLLTNASHACADQGGGEILIEARTRPDDRVEVSIADNGAGIKPEHLGQLFDPFFTTKPEGKGTGLGLPIVKEIIERHHGEIRVESRPGEGARFIFSLPIDHG